MPQTVSTEYLTQLFNAIKEQHQTGLLRVEQIGRRINGLGEIYFEGGRILNVHVGDERGEPALKRISEWEHAIYTFQRLDKAPQGHQSTSLPESRQLEQAQESTEPRLSALALLLQQRATSQVNNVTHLSRPFPTKKLQGTSSPFVTETSRLSSDEQLRESAPLTRITTALPPIRISQQLILRGETLEEYRPTTSTSISPASQRWTTHLNPESQTREMPQKPPATPRLTPLSGDEAQPGKLAIFKARVTVTSTQVMQDMGRRERIVFVLLDGRRTIEHIANLLHQSENEVGQVLRKLTKMGFAEYITG